MPDVTMVLIRAKLPFSQDAATSGMSRVVAAYPELSEAGGADQPGKLSLTSKDLNFREQLHITIDKQHIFLGWGAQRTINVDDEVARMHKIVAECFQLLPSQLSEILVLFSASFRDPLNHHMIIRDSFLSGSVMTQLFGREQPTWCGIRMMGIVDELATGIAQIESDVSEDEVRSGNYKDDLLQASVGLGQRRGLDAPLDGAMHSIVLKARRFILGACKESVLDPLDNSLAIASPRRSRES